MGPMEWATLNKKTGQNNWNGLQVSSDFRVWGKNSKALRNVNKPSRRWRKTSISCVIPTIRAHKRGQHFVEPKTKDYKEPAEKYICINIYITVKGGCRMPQKMRSGFYLIMNTVKVRQPGNAPHSVAASFHVSSCPVQSNTKGKDKAIHFGGKQVFQHSVLRMRGRGNNVVVVYQVDAGVVVVHTESNRHIITTKQWQL